ncbi:MAG TPA: ABC transporter substrate-binding protein [Candidatus Binatia bacterium]|nr:ABC transporter substrate-binding protein [Candidatus Binatia bacterium]
MRRARALLCAALLACLAGSALPARAQPLQELDVGLTAKTATDWPLYVADTLGFFKRYGVSPNFVIVGSAAGNAQQLAAGSLPIGETSSTQIVEAIQGGAPIFYAVNQVITPPYTLVGKKEIKTAAGLRGKMIIIGGVNDITHVFLDALLKPTGLKPDDYTLTYAGGTNERYAALKSGSVDAAILFPPINFLALSEGYSNLGNVQSVLPSFPFDGFAVNTKWAQTHSALLVAFLKGYLQGLRWLYNPANKAQAVQILAQATNTNPDNGSKSYDEFFVQLKAFSQDGRSSSADFQKVLTALATMKVIEPPLPAPTKFYDNRYIDQANAELARGR